ncbi:ras-associating and dilute domain-containing protein [Apteryx rowi]|uniref:ras-associating and dilute domain-containing protein n=1 Tax=Apteryx rowi TaxID=308060 RepID=UPI000E1E13E4|nr:ras-associating and dilute domain-containing protein [Apteryx rowi]
MFYGSSSTMAPPSKSRLKRQSRIFSQVLYRTLSYKDRSSASSFPTAGSDDPAELSTQLSAPGVLKIFGGNICAGTNYKSVLATGSSGARELVKEALERYGLSQVNAGQYVLCDVIGRFEGSEKQWQTEGLRVLGDTEKPLLIQDLWKPREGFSRRLELRKRAEVEELASRDVDTTTAGQSRARALPVPVPGEAAGGPKAGRRKPQLEFERAAEDALLGRILSLVEPAGDDRKLTPAFLLCLCIQHSAAAFEPGDFGQLLLKAAKMIQRMVREKTKELAEKQSQHQDPASLSRLTITDLLPDLQHILFWMSNTIEILYFVQQKSPTYIQSMEEELDVKGSKESLFSSTITASEEAMTVLEEVIMYTFQQCVYYISKCLYASLPALLECNPFQNEGREAWRTSPALPEELRRVVLIYQDALDLLRQYEVHPEITSQMFAYLFFFSNTLLFNQLLDKGSSLGCFHWSKGVKLRACVRLLLEWLRGAGFEQPAQQFFAKLASVADLLAVPGSQVKKASRGPEPDGAPEDSKERASPAAAAAPSGCGAAARAAASLAPLLPADEVLESFDNHPPIILPSSGFRVDLEVETLDDDIYRHLLYVRHFLWSLQSKSPHGSRGSLCIPPKEAPTTLDVPEVRESPVAALGSTLGPVACCSPGGCVEPEADGCLPREHPGSEPQLQEKLKQLQLGRGTASKAGALPADPSCLLTPPTTPLNFDSGSLESPQGTGLQDPCGNGLNGTKASTPEGCSPTPYDYPTPASSSRSSATDDFCYVFVVELERGPIGLGMGLIDGLHTPLSSPGIYIRTLIQDSPAAADGRLSIGDRILAVNGTSLIGADYQSAVDLIRSGGKKLRFLVAKSDVEIAKKISSSSSSSS